MLSLSSIIAAIGVGKAAEMCCVSKRAVYKWMKNDALPHTDFSGVTNYAEALSSASEGRYSKEVILDAGRPVSVDGNVMNRDSAS